ncbi:NUMOD4 motif-containing HNH endonuclease [uncultured Parasutterella sp.]|uniref:NUMOD4 motif-containing HNH endonuclease n=1 Tax=uncultured Parasutterella sp. TaxID=1263098 RepID=UPI002595AB47|nr:NUMOD4 motif-containing HNH endonuclease [uncultured Parasutterella sp.]
MIEEWKDIAGYEGIYQVSNLGRIKSLERVRSDGRRYPEIIKKQTLSNKGYPMVFLKVTGKKPRNCTVHRLVALAFLPPEEGKTYIDHIDGNPLNCRLENLRWCTFRENCNFPLAKQRQSEAHKRYKFPEERRQRYKKKFLGGGNPNAKAVINVDTGEVFPSAADANRIYKLNKDAVGAAIRHGKTCAGFRWRYI